MYCSFFLETPHIKTSPVVIENNPLKHSIYNGLLDFLEFHCQPCHEFLLMLFIA